MLKVSKLVLNHIFFNENLCNFDVKYIKYIFIIFLKEFTYIFLRINPIN